MNDLNTTILASIWGRLQWDFLMQNPQLSDWLEGSRLEATDDLVDGKPVYLLIVADGDPVAWFAVHSFAIRRALSVELRRPVVVKVVAAEAVTE